jgi:hypothetical protein
MDNNNGQCGVDGSFYRKINFWEQLMQLWRTLFIIFSCILHTLVKNYSRFIEKLLVSYLEPHKKVIFLL